MDGVTFSILISEIFYSNFYNNSAGDGGALYMKNTPLNIQNSNFQQNSASLGGAIYYYKQDLSKTGLTVINCALTEN